MDAPEHVKLIFCDRSAKRRDRLPKAILGKGNDIHVTFGNNELIRFACGFPRWGQIIKRAAFIKKRCIGRI